MKVSKVVDFTTECEVEVDADDIRLALCEAFSAANQKEEQAVNIHTILRAFSDIGRFLQAFSDEQIARLNEAQRTTIGKFLEEQARRFGRLS